MKKKIVFIINTMKKKIVFIINTIITIICIMSVATNSNVEWGFLIVFLLILGMTFAAEILRKHKNTEKDILNIKKSRISSIVLIIISLLSLVLTHYNIFNHLLEVFMSISLLSYYINLIFNMDDEKISKRIEELENQINSKQEGE